MARRSGRLLFRIDRRGTRQLECFSRRLCNPAGTEAIQPIATVQTFEARSFVSQIRIAIQVNVTTPSGIIPTSRFFPSHGGASACRRASKLNVPLPKIHPAWRPIDNHNERVSTRASARIQPITNNVTNADATIIGSPTRPSEWAIEFKPELHVT